MKDEDKAREQLISELVYLRRRNEWLEAEAARHKQRLERLRRCESILENLAEGIIITDFDGLITYANKETEKLTGYTKEELTGKSPAILNAEANCEEIQREIFHCMQVSKSWRGELLQRRKDGSTYKGYFEIYPVHDAEGPVLLWMSLRANQLRDKALIEALPVGLFYTNQLGHNVYTNEKTSEITGFPGSKMLNFDWVETIHPEDREKVLNEWQRCIKHQEFFKLEYRFQRPDGSISWVIGQAAPYQGYDNRLLGYVGTLSDITERKKAEQALEIERQRLYSLLNNSPAIIFLLAPDHSIRFANRNFIELFGEADNRLCYQVIKGRREPCERCCLQKVIAEKKPLSFEHTRADGATYQVYNYPFLDLDGSPLLLALCIDITDRKKAEEALRRAEQEKGLILRTIAEDVTYVDSSMKIIWVNEAASQTAGLPPDQMKSRHCYEIYKGRNSPCPGCPVRKAMETGYFQEGETVTPDGRAWIVRAHPVKDSSGLVVGAVEVALEITEKKRIEQEMARLERLNIVGEMAAGIGHEIRNPMTTVRGFLQMLGEKQENVHYKEYYDLMITELDRVNQIISEFLSLAKNKAVDLKKQNLNDIIAALHPLIMADALASDKQVLLELGEIPPILLDDKEIRQMLLNLVRNGLEAVPGGGKVTLKTFSGIDGVTLAVQDEGKGIGPAILEKLGTPFLTDKANGTGLGLAVCFRIAQRHNAGIEVETSPGGTTFYIRFQQAQN